MKRQKKRLSDEDVSKILSVAKEASFFDYVALRTLVVLDLRGAALVGQSDHRPGMFPNPGMLIENMTDKGIWVNEKKKEEKVFKPIPAELRAEIDELINDRECQTCQTTYVLHPKDCETPKFGRIFPRTRAWLWERTRHYAKRAGIIDWNLVHPHRFRAWATTRAGRKFGVIRARDLAGHKSIATTNTYLDHSEDSEIQEASQFLEEALA